MISPAYNTPLWALALSEVQIARTSARVLPSFAWLVVPSHQVHHPFLRPEF